MRSAPSHRGLALLLASLVMLGPFSIDAMFPAFGVMGDELRVSPAALQQVISVYLAAFAVMALLHGPISDAYGRRPTILFALALFAASTLGCGLAPNFHVLLFFRGLQGVFAGAGMIVGRAIIRDRFHGAEAQRMLASVNLIFGIAPAVAPVAGGWMVTPVGWRGIFNVLALASVCLWMVCYRTLPETHPKTRRGRLSPRALLRIYREVLRDRRFLALAAAAALNFGALFVYVACAPKLIVSLLHLDERGFGWLFIPLIGGMMTGSVLVQRLSERLRADRIVRYGYTAVGVGLLANFVVAFAVVPARVPWSVLPLVVLGGGVSLAFPALTLLMLDRFPLNRGAAASVQAMSSLGINAMIAGALSPLVAGGMPGLAVVAAAFSLASFVCWRWVRVQLKREGVPPTVAAHPSGVSPAADV